MVEISGNYCRRIKSWVESQIATHKGDVSAHHTKYTNAEAISATERKSGFRVTRETTPQTIANLLITIVHFNNEVFDIDNEYNITTHEFTVKTKGYYFLSVNLTLQALSDGAMFATFIRSNGVNQAIGRVRAGSAGTGGVSVATVSLLNIGDVVKVWVFHNSGGNIDLNHGVGYCNFVGYLLEKY